MKTPTVYAETPHASLFKECVRLLIPKYPHVYFRPPVDRLAMHLGLTWIEANCVVGADINMMQEHGQIIADIEALLGKVADG